MSERAAVDARTANDRSALVLGGILAGGALLGGVFAGELSASGRGADAFALGVVALLVVLWRNPGLSPIVLLAAALLVEQFPLGTAASPTMGARPSDATDRIPFFHGLAPSLHISPADLLLLTLFAIWMLKRGTNSFARLSRSSVTYAMGAVMVCVWIGILVGQAHHGQLRTALTEVRPYAYLGVAYLVASTFTTRREVIRWALWALVLASGFKAVQALVSFMNVRHENPRPDYVVGHEEALFFGLFVLATLGLWLYEVRGRLRVTATILLPVVLAADLVNTRRAAWLILGGALIVFAAVGMASLPRRRRFLRRVLIVLALVSAVYFPAYWNHTGALAGPARAVHSAIKANPRDESSDLYRVQENANLKLNIREGGFVGRGFGVPIDYVLPIVNLDKVDPLIVYVPHNGVFYILMRMGLLGGIAFWSLLGVAIIGGCRLARSHDREFAFLGGLVACAVVAYALEGYNDQGFFMYRIAFVMGTLLGLAEAARRLAREAPGQTPTDPPPTRAMIIPIARPAAATAGASAVPSPAGRARPRRPRPVVVPRPAAGAWRPRVPAGIAAAIRVGRPAARVSTAAWQRRAQFTAAILLPLAVACLLWVSLAGPSHFATSAGGPRIGEAVFTSTGAAASVEIRRGSSEGAPLYAGTLRQGHSIAAGGARLWVHLVAPRPVSVTYGGRKLIVRGPGSVLLTPSGPRVLH